MAPPEVTDCALDARDPSPRMMKKEGAQQALAPQRWPSHLLDTPRFRIQAVG